MSEATTRALIKTELDTVTEIGKTHDYTRWAITFEKFLTFFKTILGNKEQVRGWSIECENWEEKRLTFTGNQRQYTYTLRGYLGLNDAKATGKTFTALTEDVCEAINSAATLGRASGSPWMEEPAQVPDITHRLFGGALCHYCEINLTINELVSTA